MIPLVLIVYQRLRNFTIGQSMTS